MEKYLPLNEVELLLSRLTSCDIISICSDAPISFFNACWADIWQSESEVSAGGIVRPSDNNGFIYECIEEGITGEVEPIWMLAQDNTFYDGTVRWKTHENYCLVFSPLLPEDFLLEEIEEEPGKYRLTLANKYGLTSNADGEVSHTALLCSEDKSLRFVSTSFTSAAGTNEISKGRVVHVEGFYIEYRGVV